MTCFFFWEIKQKDVRSLKIIYKTNIIQIKVIMESFWWSKHVLGHGFVFQYHKIKKQHQLITTWKKSEKYI